MISWLILLTLFNPSTCDEVVKVISEEGKNEIIFEELGTLWTHVKRGYLRFELDLSKLYKTADDLEKDYNRQKGLKEHDSYVINHIETDLKMLKDQIKLVKKYGRKLESKEYELEEDSDDPLKGIVEPREWEIPTAPKMIQNVEHKQPDKPKRVYENPMLMLNLDIMEAKYNMLDVVQMLKQIVEWKMIPTISKFDRNFDVEAATKKLRQTFDDKNRYKVSSQNGYSFKKIGDSKFEILQKLIFISDDYEFKLYERLDLPLVYNNEIFIEFEANRHFVMHPKRETFAILPKEYYHYCQSKSFGKQRFCTESLKLEWLNKNDFQKTCYGTLLFKNFQNIHENCLTSMHPAKSLAKSTGRSEFMTYTPDPEVATLDCSVHQHWEKKVYLYKFQSLQIPGYCELRTSSSILFGRSHDPFSVTKEYIKHSVGDLEKIWPQLTNKRLRGIVTKEEGRNNLRVSRSQTNVTVNLGIRLTEEL